MISNDIKIISPGCRKVKKTAARKAVNPDMTTFFVCVGVCTTVSALMKVIIWLDKPEKRREKA